MSATATRPRFYSNCVGWPHPVGPLMYLVENARPITRKTFLQHVDREDLREIEERLGYEHHPRCGLTMSGDHCVSYYRSCGIYYFRWSAIEHIFATEDQIEALLEKGKDR